MNARLQNSLLFIIPSLIWGSTWYAIKFQLGSVDPLMSVAYRFFMAGSILVLFCLLFKHNMRFGYQDHLLFLLQGVLLFGVNYWLVYMAEQQLTSGLIAVIFSLVVITNAVFGAIFIRSKITWKLVIGGIFAISGTALIFEKEIGLLFGGGFVLSAVIMSFTSLILASLGNILSAYSQQKAIPLLQANAYSMIYGALAVFIIGLIIGRKVSFEMDYPYILSLSYLAIFGSVIAFSSYLKIVGSMGPAKASYALVLVPLIAMVFSTIFESYEWQTSALLGMPILIIGNMIAMDKLKPEILFKKWKMKTKLLILLVGLTALMCSCNKDNESIELIEISGITEFDSSGNQIGNIDSTDWKFTDTWTLSEENLFKKNSSSNLETEITPPNSSVMILGYPNPAKSQIVFAFQLETELRYDLRIVDKYLNIKSDRDSVTYQFYVMNSTDYKINELFRIYYKIYSENKVYRGHGDFKFVE